MEKIQVIQTQVHPRPDSLQKLKKVPKLKIFSEALLKLPK